MGSDRATAVDLEICAMTPSPEQLMPERAIVSAAMTENIKNETSSAFLNIPVDNSHAPGVALASQNVEASSGTSSSSSTVASSLGDSLPLSQCKLIISTPASTSKQSSIGSDRMDEDHESETAAQQVLRLPELVKRIVDNLSWKELFDVQRVSRTFHDTIADCTKLQQRMFLKPTATLKHLTRGGEDGTGEVLDAVRPHPFFAVDDEYWEDTLVAGLDECIKLDENIASFYYLQANHRTNDKEHCINWTLFARTTSKNAMSRLGLNFPRPLLRACITQPLYFSHLQISFPSDDAAAFRRIRGFVYVQDSVHVHANVRAASFGDWLAAAREMPGHEPDLEYWVGCPVYKEGPRKVVKITVPKTRFSTMVQDLLYDDPVFSIDVTQR